MPAFWCVPKGWYNTNSYVLRVRVIILCYMYVLKQKIGPDEATMTCSDGNIHNGIYSSRVASNKILCEMLNLTICTEAQWENQPPCVPANPQDRSLCLLCSLGWMHHYWSLLRYRLSFIILSVRSDMAPSAAAKVSILAQPGDPLQPRTIFKTT